MTDSALFLVDVEEIDAIRLADEVEDEAAPSKVFAQTITTPPGLPWEQARAARLEAGLSSPLPMSELVLQLHRLEPWALGAAGRFAACYVRRHDAEAGIAETLILDGRPIEVRFEAPAMAARKRRLQLVVAVSTAVIVAISIAAISSALAARDENEARLEALEAQVQARQRQADQKLRLAAEADALETADVSARDLDHVLSDLNWVTSAKAPDAKLSAWIWEKGAMAVEARGEQSPFQNADRLVKRAPKPIRRGVYLYGVEPASGFKAAGGG